MRAETSRGTIKRTFGGTSDGQSTRDLPSVGPQTGCSTRPEGRDEVESARLYHAEGASDGRSDEYWRLERLEAERELLLLLARGEKEIAAGIGHSLDQVLAEADALLAKG